MTPSCLPSHASVTELEIAAFAAFGLLLAGLC